MYCTGRRLVNNKFSNKDKVERKNTKEQIKQKEKQLQIPKNELHAAKLIDG
jgi:hypothetical protein